MITAGTLGSKRIELIDGELIEMAAQHVPHLWVKTRVQRLLDRALEAAGSPLVVSAEASFAANMHNVPQPDIAVWERVRVAGLLPAAQVRLAVEVCATSNALDYGRKASLYASAGVPEYWIVDLAERAITVMTAPERGAYTGRFVVPFGDPLTSPTLGIEIATDALD